MHVARSVACVRWENGKIAVASTAANNNVLLTFLVGILLLSLLLLLYRSTPGAFGELRNCSNRFPEVCDPKIIHTRGRFWGNVFLHLTKCVIFIVCAWTGSRVRQHPWVTRTHKVQVWICIERIECYERIWAMDFIVNRLLSILLLSIISVDSLVLVDSKL